MSRSDSLAHEQLRTQRWHGWAMFFGGFFFGVSAVLVGLLIAAGML